MLPQTTIPLSFVGDLRFDGCGNVDHSGLSVYFTGKVGRWMPLPCDAATGWLATLALYPYKRTSSQRLPLVQNALHMVLAGLFGPEKLAAELTWFWLHLVC